MDRLDLYTLAQDVLTSMPAVVLIVTLLQRKLRVAMTQLSDIDSRITRVERRLEKHGLISERPPSIQIQTPTERPSTRPKP
jgi:hypothetical protein